MNIKPIIIGAISYTVVTFPLAVLWHVVFFKPTYEQFGYFGGEPSFVLGFSSILVQGFVLSLGHGFAKLHGSPTIRGIKYALFMGIFFWTCHVLAFAAKNAESNTSLFYVFESVYLTLQFGIYGVIIGKVYARYGSKQVGA